MRFALPARALVCAALLPLTPFVARAARSLAEHRIGQKNKVFSQTALTVKVGDVVVFHNDDAVAHNVFSGTPGAAFNLKSQAPGSETHVNFDHEGTVDVRCAFHPTMKLTVTVQK